MTDVADMTAAQRLRVFEDQVLPGAPRINGQIEDGIGSPFSSLPETYQEHHRALCSLCVAEHLLAMAVAEHARLDGVYRAALAKVSATARHVSHTETTTTTEELA
jgi:hypothetical protein